MSKTDKFKKGLVYIIVRRFMAVIMFCAYSIVLSVVFFPSLVLFGIEKTYKVMLIPYYWMEEKLT